MSRKPIPLAIAYDFDGTLAPGNMQEFDFVPKIGMKSKEFWDEVKAQAKDNDADNILVYMKLMLDKATQYQVSVTKGKIEDFGRGIKLFEGVEKWFDRVDIYGKDRGVQVRHFIISSGLGEMIRGTVIAKKFKHIFASSFLYDHNNVAVWPALAVNYTTKTQFLFRINKGVLNVHEHEEVNKFVKQEDRPVPFENIVFVGDGDTDVPCFRLVKDLGGHSIAVYKQNARGAKAKADKLMGDGRVNLIAPAHYGEGERLDQLIRSIIDKVAADGKLKAQGKV